MGLIITRFTNLKNFLGFGGEEKFFWVSGCLGFSAVHQDLNSLVGTISPPLPWKRVLGSGRHAQSVYITGTSNVVTKLYRDTQGT